jgi:hypothetical protein
LTSTRAGLPIHAVEALGKHRAKMQELGLYEDSGLVFCSANGTATVYRKQPRLVLTRGAQACL